jgi:hypothetical protein
VKVMILSCSAVDVAGASVSASAASALQGRARAEHSALPVVARGRVKHHRASLSRRVGRKL